MRKTEVEEENVDGPRTLPPTSIRITPKCKWLWDALSNHMGLSRTGVIETAIRRLAKEEGVYMPNEKLGD